MTLVAALGGITFDGVTVDSDGVVWCAEMIDGWHDSTPVVSSRTALPYGDTLTSTRQQARPLLLHGMAKESGANGRLSTDWYLAERHLKRAMRFEYLPGLLVVTEPAIALQSYVRRAEQTIRCRRRGRLHTLEFEVPLLAPDPRRYSSSVTTDADLALTGVAVLVNDTATTLGDQQTAPIITIDGPAVNPRVTNLSAARTFQVATSLGGGDTLVIDMGASTVILNGVTNLRSSVVPLSQFWSLIPGANSVRYERDSGSGTSTASIAWRDAYS